MKDPLLNLNPNCDYMLFVNKQLIEKYKSIYSRQIFAIRI